MMIKFVQDRLDIILKYARGKKVLDCGCVDTLKEIENPRKDWLYGKLVEVAKKVVGVDLQEEGVRKLREKGYEVICADVTTMDLGQKFDVIVAGEIIEHLPNQGLFLKNMKRHLKRDGVLIITTPNALAFFYWFLGHLRWNTRWKYGSPKWGESPHVSAHIPDTLWALAETHGYTVELYGGFDRSRKEGIRIPVMLFSKLFCRLFPQFSPILVAVLRPKG